MPFWKHFLIEMAEWQNMQSDKQNNAMRTKTLLICGTTAVALLLVGNVGRTAEPAPSAAATLAGKTPTDTNPLPGQLCDAIRQRDVIKVKAVLEGGTDVNAKDKSGQTPLHLAANEPNTEIIALLLTKGANVNATNNIGWTPLFGAALHGNRAIAELLLAKGASFNAKSKSGETPLHLMPFDGKPVVAELLLSKGANIDVRGPIDQTPLHIAAYHGKTEIADFLLAHRADVNAHDSNGATPLHLAVRQKSQAIVERLLANGADVNATNNTGQTPLFANPDKTIAELLVAKGANLKLTDTTGRTALINAAYQGNNACAEVLIAHGADVNVAGKDRITALDWAERKGNKPLGELLLANGATAAAAPAPAQSAAPVITSHVTAAKTDGQVDFIFEGLHTQKSGNKELLINPQFPSSCQLGLSGKLTKIVTADGTDLLPTTEKDRRLVEDLPLPLFNWRGKMSGHTRITLRPFNDARLKELAGTFTCLVGEWKEMDLGLTGFTAGMQGTNHGAKIQKIEPWKLAGATQLLALSLDVPVGASKQFVFYDGVGAVLPVRQIQQEVGPAGTSITKFLLETGKFPAAGRVVAKIIEGQPVEFPFALHTVDLRDLK